MIVEYLRYEIEEARQEVFVADYKAAAAPLMASPHALSFDLCQCADAPGQFILRIEWSSAKDHLQGFRNSPEFGKFFAHIKPYLGDIQEMRHYNRLIEARG